MQIVVRFPGGDRVDADFRGFTVPTDQPPADGGRPSAPSPFETFLASLATCAGIYVLSFCTQRGISTEGLSVVQHAIGNPVTHMVDRVRLEIHLPAGFPDKYRDAIIRAAEQCSVKKHLEHPPSFEIETIASEFDHGETTRRSA